MMRAAVLIIAAAFLLAAHSQPSYEKQGPSADPETWPMVLHWYVSKDYVTQERHFIDFPNRKSCVDAAIELQSRRFNAWCDFWHW
jgi:hypothetical protein